MKLFSNPSGTSRAESGSAVMLVLIMLGIMTIFVAVNTVTIRTVSRELKLLEKKQVRRLDSAALPKTAPANPAGATPSTHE
ncbi:MAG TPA: hypothetical protein VH413_08280 [Verrucomicrobiae bacterium]|jgi:hypothetical protein|nr:hypothetical protein [Verrucomicrobiae bacterium]